MKNKKFMSRVFACVLAGAMVLSMAAFAADCTHPTGYLKINTGDAETHDLVCVDCDEIIGTQEHTFGADGTCVCGKHAPVTPDEDYDAAMNVEPDESVVITVTYICDGTVVKTIDYTMDGESDTFTVTAPNGFVFSKNFNNELNVCDAEGEVITSRTVFVHADETLDSDIFVDAGDDAAQPDEYLPIDDNMDASMNVGRSFFSVVWDFLFGWTRFFK